MKKLAAFFLTLLFAVSVHSQILSVGGATTTWDPANISGFVTLSNANLTATGTGGSQAGGATTSITTAQKKYFEVTNNADPATGVGVGFVNSTFNKTSYGGFLGGDSTALAYYAVNGEVVFNNTIVATFSTYGTAVVVGVAVDFAAGNVWFTIDGVNWNAGGTASPIGNVGGLAVGVTGNLFPAFSVSLSDQVTANFSGGPFTYSTLFTALQGAGYTHF